MNKPDQVFVWHCGSELPSVYDGFRDTFAGPKGGIQLGLYDPQGDDDMSITHDDIIPNAVKRSYAVIILLTGKETVGGELYQLLQSIADAPYPMTLALVFLYPTAKEWWLANVEPNIESLRSQFVEPIDVWSEAQEPAVLTGQTRDVERVRRIEGLRKRIESKVRELTAFRMTPVAPAWGSAKGRDVLLLSSGTADSDNFATSLSAALLSMPDVRTVPWPKWQERSSQTSFRDLLKRPVLFVRVVTDAAYTQISAAEFRRTIRAAIGLSDLDFGMHWNSMKNSLRLDWAPNARKSSSGNPSDSGSSNDGTQFASLGTSATDMSLEIGRCLGIVKPAPPRVGFITISRDNARKTLVPNPETFENNLKIALRQALRDALQGRVNPAEPEIRDYHEDFDLMIEKAIGSGRIPVLLADDLSSSAQRPPVEEILKRWEAHICTTVAKKSRSTKVIKGALIYFNAADFEGLASIPYNDLQSWYPLVVDDAGAIAPKQLEAMTLAVKAAFPDPA
jgi:hypothetical protein